MGTIFSVYPVFGLLTSFHMFEVRIELSLEGSRTFCRPEPTLGTPPTKTQGFAPESVFTREFTRSRTRSPPHYLIMELT